jgi:hypothetical protein
MTSPNDEPKEATLVRSSDGTLYLVTKDAAPQKIDLPAFVQTATKALEEAEDKISKAIREHCHALGGGTHNVHVTFPVDVVPKE